MKTNQHRPIAIVIFVASLLAMLFPLTTVAREDIVTPSSPSVSKKTLLQLGVDTSVQVAIGPLVSTIFVDETWDPNADPAIVNKIEVFGQLQGFFPYNICDMARQNPAGTIIPFLGLEGQNIQIGPTVNDHAWQITADGLLTVTKVPGGMLYFDGNQGTDWKLDAEFLFQPFKLQPTPDRLVFWTCVSRDNTDPNVVRIPRIHPPVTSCVTGDFPTVTNTDPGLWSQVDYYQWHYEGPAVNLDLTNATGVIGLTSSTQDGDYVNIEVSCEG